MEFREVSDEEWDIIRADDRMVLNGILYVLVTGCESTGIGS